jgi:AcrR family transcriptional regulator
MARRRPSASPPPDEKRPRAAKRSPMLRDERRAQLVHAAREVFGAKGYHDATVDDITRAAGVAKGTFYLYFE